MTNINFGLLDPNAFQKGYEQSKGVVDGVSASLKQRGVRQAVEDLQADPTNAEARAFLYSNNSSLAAALESSEQQRVKTSRENETRNAMSDWMLSQGTRPRVNALAGPVMPAGAPQANSPVQPANALNGSVNALSAAPPMAAQPSIAATAAAPQASGTPSPGDPQWERYVRADPSGAMKSMLERQQLTKAQNEAMTSQMDVMARLARGAVDQPTYEAALQRAQSMGLDTSSMPPQFDPAAVNAIELQALSAKEHLVQQRADRKQDWDVEDDAIDNSRADRVVDSQDSYRRGQLSNARRGQNMTDARTRGSAAYQGRGGRGGRGSSDAARAVDPKTGHAIVVKDGRWVDEKTGKPVS